MTGILNGNELFLTYAVPPVLFQGFFTCGIAGLGNATASGSGI